MQAFLIALQFLTRLPITLAQVPSVEQNGRSALYYPLVGLLIGGLLILAQHLLSDVPILLQAALLLSLWVAVTGGLHLDGLADSADAWAGGFGDRQRTLDIMQDPRSGPIAVVVLMLLLLLKFAALVALLSLASVSALVLAPLLARSALPLLFLTTPYVRKGGLGEAFSTHLPRKQLPWLLAAVVGLALIFVPGAWLAVVMAGLVFALCRHLMLKRIGGTTGDTAGALLEVLECAIVVVLACAAN
ncbi:adenosylcobinamide-GDP ribazoletransferase [Pseudomonas sp. NPDC078700]|uniref:adenosylcobinamide-GDP ribazoletransferase n=1 Tax=Pseudomonas sp. NPDC078700 TaxID=3364424 RepID=UPI0037C56E10